MTPIHLIGEHYCLPIPVGAHGFDINKYCNGSELNYWLIAGAKDTLIVTDLPPGNWQIICTTKECTEEQAKGIAQVFAANLPGTYRNHEWLQGPDFYTEAVASVRSLVRSKGLDPNKTLIIKKVS